MPRLCVYRFDPGATFEGGLVGALERAELAEGAKVVDALLVRRDASSGDVDAVALSSASGDNRFVVLTDFRMNADRRAKLTTAAFDAHPDAEAAATTLEPGAALLAVLFGGEASASIADAVERAGGRLVADEAADEAAAAQLGLRLRQTGTA